MILYILLSSLLLVELSILIIIVRDKRLKSSRVHNYKYPLTPDEAIVNYFPIFEMLCKEMRYDYNNVLDEGFYWLYLWPKHLKPDNGFQCHYFNLNDCFKYGVRELTKVKEKANELCAS